jgi:DnaK suppressor protein
MKHLTGGQRAWLEAELQQRQQQLGRRLKDHHGGLTRAEHAREVLEQDGDDAPQREGEREIDMALSDLESAELMLVGNALTRLRAGEAGGYGVCMACGIEIPFDRLKAEPWAPRCVPCQSQLERGAPRQR